MSYILEALKKAQAERQLGTSPTLHAPTLHAADRAETGGRLKKPLVLAVVAMGAVIAVLLVMVLRPASQPVSQPALQRATPAATAPATVAAAPAPAPALAAASTAAPVSAPSLPEPAASAAPLPAPLPVPLPAPVAALPPPVARLPVAAVPTPAVAKPASAPEEPVMNQRDLPEPIQRSIPQIAVGGYIYSKNPADRLLLIDKVLRHEGEEVAPGLTLEKLQPKEAVFNFKGYRYRVPY
jgi:general secretion pathway protein B